MPPVRERMRPWLERLINSNSVSGLSWINQEKSMFSIPWKHAARRGWIMDEDATIFKLWAIHTGKYVAGQMCNPKIWKANFRCALHSLPDVEEVKDRSVHKGHEAVRVYRMLPEARKPRDRRRQATKNKPKRKIKMETLDPDYEPSHGESGPTQESTVDSTVPGHQHSLELRLVDASEVPDVSAMEEVGTYKFQLSPEYSPDSSYDAYNFTNRISQALDKVPLPVVFTGTEVRTSTGSQWSEESSGEGEGEGEDMEPLFSCLTASLLPPAELWSDSPPQTLLSL